MSRPIKPPRWSLETTIKELHTALDHQPADVPVGVGRAALAHLERMQTEAREIQQELWRLKHIEELYADLVTEWNTVAAALETRGIEVYMPMGAHEWIWINGDRRGTAPTSSEAIVAALNSAA